jgi:hypothetical protein
MIKDLQRNEIINCLSLYPVLSVAQPAYKFVMVDCLFVCFLHGC